MAKVYVPPDGRDHTVNCSKLYATLLENLTGPTCDEYPPGSRDFIELNNTTHIFIGTVSVWCILIYLLALKDPIHPIPPRCYNKIHVRFFISTRESYYQKCTSCQEYPPVAGIPPYDGRDRIVQSERLNVQH